MSLAPPETGRKSMLGARQIRKCYGPVLALDSVDFDVGSGEVAGLVGDNGAGKSTLIKVFAGVEHPDSGYVVFDGAPVAWRSAAQARAAGIETAFQDLALCETLTIVRNFFLGKEIAGSLLSPMRLQRMRTEARDALGSFRLRIRSVDAPVRSLSGGERQAIAIARAVHFGARVLILDEPTNALSVNETDKVLDAIREAVRRNIAVIVITHTLAYVNDLADRVYVLQQGKVIVTVARGELSTADMEDIIAGRTRVGGDVDAVHR